jgi:hypothetical protein
MARPDGAVVAALCLLLRRNARGQEDDLVSVIRSFTFPTWLQGNRSRILSSRENAWDIFVDVLFARQDARLGKIVVGG